MNRSQLGAPMIAAVFACTDSIPHAVLTVEDPKMIAGAAVALGVGESLDALERKELDGRPFPVTLTLSTERSYDGRVWVEAYDAEGRAIARGVGQADIRVDNPSTVLIAVYRACATDENCDDKSFCSGVETCSEDRFCVDGRPPCRSETPHACVLTSLCTDTAEGGACSGSVDHTLCPQTADAPTYCDLITGCTPGVRCTSASDNCSNDLLCDGVETCELYHCVSNAPESVADTNECNADACQEGVGTVHYPDPLSTGRKCNIYQSAEPGICKFSECMISICGDELIDDRFESCEDGNVNPSDGCDACRTTEWRPTVIAGLGEANGVPGELAFNTPTSIAVNAAGDLYVAEADSGRILRIDGRAHLATVFAGNGSAEYTGDFGLAIAAGLGRPISIAADNATGVYVLDGIHKVVRRIDVETGIITTVAGGGNDTAEETTNARTLRLEDPSQIGIDGAGFLWIAEATMLKVFKVRVEDGMISQGFVMFGDPAAFTLDYSGFLSVVDRMHQQIWRLDRFDGVMGLIPRNAVTRPYAGAVGSTGLVYVIGEGANQILEFNNEMISTPYAGTGVEGSSGDDGPATSATIDPRALAVNLEGDLFILETDRQRIRVVRRDTRMIENFAGNGRIGPGLQDSAATALPIGTELGALSTAADGKLYLLERSKRSVLAVDAATGALDVIAGAGEGVVPRAIAVDGSNNVYFADERTISKIDAATRAVSVIAGDRARSGTCDDGVPAIGACFESISRVVFARGDLYISDAGRISRVDLDTMQIFRVAEGLSAPAGIAVDAIGNVYFAEPGAHRVRRRATDGTLAVVAGTGTAGAGGELIPATSSALNTPRGVAIDSSGLLVIADSGNHRLRRVLANGTITTVAGEAPNAGAGGDGGPASAATLNDPFDVASGPNGALYVINENPGIGSVRKIDGATAVISTVAGAVDPSGDALLGRSRLGSPSSLARVGGTTENPVWWIADGVTGRIREVDMPNGVVNTIAGYPGGRSAEGADARWSRLLENPSGVAFDAAGRTVYVAERDAHVIRKIDLSVSPPAISTFAGQRGNARHVDGTLAESRFYSPAGLLYDRDEKTLYVADAGNHAIRAIDTVEPATVRTIAGTPGVRGFNGDGAAATGALFDTPTGLALGRDGTLYIADSRNNRVRHILRDGKIETVLGDGEPANSGTGAPARFFPVKEPTGLVVDQYGNLFVAASDAIRRVSAGADNTPGPNDVVSTVYGAAPREVFPESVTRCLSDVALVEGRGGGNGSDLFVLDACQGFLIRLERGRTPGM